MDTKALSQHSLIISDLHLSETETAANKLFFDFLENTAKTAENLYILGDFFAAWIGDDDLTPYHLKVIAALKAVSDAGVKLYFMAGNRDFLVGKRFADMTHATILPDPTVVELYGKRILLMHGDTLCTDDVPYLRYRKVVRQTWLQRLFLCLPLRWRRAIANQLRAKSRGNFIYQDVNPFAVQKVMAEHKVDYLVHGHTHRFAMHFLDHDKLRLVLGAWHDQGSYVKVNFEGLSLHQLER
jgi:UDP-2,3-diacylglucosamine hydrolase